MLTALADIPVEVSELLVNWLEGTCWFVGRLMTQVLSHFMKTKLSINTVYEGSFWKIWGVCNM